MSDNILPHERFRVPTETLRVLNRRALFPWLSDAIIDWSVIVMAIASSSYFDHWLVYLTAIFVIGNRQHALALLGHDGTHYVLSSNKKMNDAFTNACAWWPLGLTNGGYRNLHNRHHRYVGTEDDPEVVHKKARSPQWDLPAKPATIAKYILKDLVGYSVPDYWIIVSFSKPSNRIEYLGLFLFHGFANIVLFSFGAWWICALWYFSLVTTFMMFFRIRLWLEHQGAPNIAHRLSLTKLEGALFAPHLSWHHWEHHQWPAVPYWNLPKLRALVQTEPCVTLRQVIAHLKDHPELRVRAPQIVEEF